MAYNFILSRNFNVTGICKNPVFTLVLPFVVSPVA